VAKIQPFAVKKTIEYLGMEEEECKLDILTLCDFVGSHSVCVVVNAVVEHVRQRKPPAALAEELEPVRRFSTRRPLLSTHVLYSGPGRRSDRFHDQVSLKFYDALEFCG
jgi:hypothetical protein